MPENDTLAPPLTPGRVRFKSKGFYLVRAEEREVLCRITNKLRKKLVFPTADASSARQGVSQVRGIRAVDPIAVGDQVRFIDTGGGTGTIREVLPRRNRFGRRASRGRRLEQVIAANFDQVVAVVAAAEPAPGLGLLDRYLVEAELHRVPIRICFTKVDLAVREILAEIIAIYRKIGYSVTETSALTGEGIDELKSVLQDRASVLVGESGVGKTTLLNTLQPGLDRRVRPVQRRRSAKGRHTTTTVEMIELEIGARVIDTPGIREMGIWFPVDCGDLASCFPEFRPLVGDCSFGESCTHLEEPGCAVLAALEESDVDPGRYHSFTQITAERERFGAGISDAGAG